MKLKTKYHYTYFVYPFVVRAKDYYKFILKMLINDEWKEKIFNKVDDAEIDGHFMALAKNKMFPTLKWDEKQEKNFNDLNTSQKAKVLSRLSSCMFEYNFKENTKGRIYDNSAIFFEISQIKLMCFKDGICFLLVKAEVDDPEYVDFNKILNLNYKFRNVTPQFLRLKDYDYIKIQSNRFDTSEDIKNFINRICAGYESVGAEDIYTNRMFVYSYSCLDESEWNSQKSFSNVRSEFLKYKYVLSGDYDSEFADNIENEGTYSRWKYSMYGFTKMSGILFTSATDHFNYTKLPFYYENVYLYIMIYAFYQRLSYVLLLRDIEVSKNKKKLKEKILRIAKINSLNQVTNAEHGMMLWQNWSKAFELKEMYKNVIDCYKLL